MSFWEFFWFIVITYAFMTYLIVLFRIVTDLFRDRDTSGAVKAAWMIALIFVPFLSALVYLITRGDDMARRAMDRAAEQRAQQDAYIRETAGTTSPADQIAQAKGLLSRGDITEDEYSVLKAKALA